MVGLFDRLFSTSPEQRAARALYAAIVGQSRRPGYYTVCGVPDTPSGRFEVLALNLFLVMYRLRTADRDKLARALSEEAVVDIDRNLREMGVGDLSVGRKVKQLTKSLYGRFGAYAAGLEGDDGTLVAALQRNLFAGNAGDPLAVSEIVTYLRRQAASLSAQADGALEVGQVVFEPAPGERSGP